MPFDCSLNPLQSCLAVSGSYFTVDRLTKNMNRVGFLDKVLKAADPVFDAIQVIAGNNGASADTMKEIGNARQLAKTGRDVMAFFNVLNGIFQEVAKRVHLLVTLALHLISSEEKKINVVKLKDPEFDSQTKAEKPMAYNHEAHGTVEQLAAMGENLGKTVAGLSYIVGFGLCRPIANVEKHISKNVHPTASNVAKAFPTVMMVNHIGGVIGSSCALLYQNLAYYREVEKGELGFIPLEKPKEGETPEQARIKYRKKVDESYIKYSFANWVGLAEKSLELVMDIFHHTKTFLPAEARLPLTMSIGVLALTKEWIKE